ncbi:hypothetical protein IKJ53_04575 [bacterium]|nr:hypothetical protein [bacterium]
MLGINNQPSMMPKSVNFKGVSSDLKYDIETERDQKIDQFTKDKAEWDEFADNLEQSDSKVAKKAGKVVRLGASILGLAATFVGAKYGSKLAIETLKSFTKNDTAKKVVENVKKLKRPVMRAMVYARKAVRSIAKQPSVQKAVETLKNSKATEAIQNFVKNEKVAKVLEPVKTTIKSMKDVKIDGKKVQNFIENTMAVTTTGSVLVDDLAGRNNDKSATELAMGA